MTIWSSPGWPAAISTDPRCAGATLRRAGLRPLRFHDLRHTFGTRMIAKADIRGVQEWMGHADVQTTMKYLHYVAR
jgi:integrase